MVMGGSYMTVFISCSVCFVSLLIFSLPLSVTIWEDVLYLGISVVLSGTPKA